MRTIFRTNPKTGFTVLANAMLRNASLSYKSRGILAMILSHSEEWEVHASWITQQGTEGREAIASAMKELEASGYVQYQELRDEDKKFTGGMWTFSDSPCPQPERTNRTRWKSGMEVAPAQAGELPEPEASPAESRDTGSRSTGSRVTANRGTGTPQHGEPAAKKKEVEKKEQPSEETKAEPVQESPEDLMGWQAIGAALLAAYDRPAYDIQRLGNDEQHWLSDVDHKCTRAELASLVRFIKKPYNREDPLLISRATKLRTLLPNFREQVNLAVKSCPPTKKKPDPASPASTAAASQTPPKPTDEEQAAAAEKARRMVADWKATQRPGAAKPVQQELMPAAANAH